MQKLAKYYDTIILGAGAAGLICAFTAAQRGLKVLVLEKSNKVGKKILMSGGGRCNFTNYNVEADNFISDNPHFCKSALSQYSQWDFIAMAERHGIEYTERKHGQLFCSHSAKDILAMLLKESELAGVQIKTNCAASQISAATNGASRYRLMAHKQQITTNALVVATGALSIPTLGGSGYGYEIAGQFDLNITERRAGLAPFMFSDDLKPICERLSGNAVEATVSCNGQSFTEGLLFTHRGLSGPVILQISSYWRPGDAIIVDLLPNIGAVQWLVSAKAEQGKSRLQTLLNPILGKSVVKELQTLWWPTQADTALAEFSDKQLLDLGTQLNNWTLKPSATEGYRTAEVTLGGVDTNNLSSKTMEAKQQTGLFFIGEVVDVSGHLGGFNFQWAWSSGYCAGLAV